MFLITSNHANILRVSLRRARRFTPAGIIFPVEASSLTVVLQSLVNILSTLTSTTVFIKIVKCIAVHFLRTNALACVRIAHQIWIVNLTVGVSLPLALTLTIGVICHHDRAFDRLMQRGVLSIKGDYIDVS